MFTKEEKEILVDLVTDEISYVKDSTFYKHSPDVSHLWTIIHKLEGLETQ